MTDTHTMAPEVEHELREAGYRKGTIEAYEAAQAALAARGARVGMAAKTLARNISASL